GRGADERACRGGTSRRVRNRTAAARKPALGPAQPPDHAARGRQRRKLAEALRRRACRERPPLAGRRGVAQPSPAGPCRSSMKIAALETFPLRGRGAQGAYGAPYGFVVKVTTDDGVVGYGETDSLPAVVDAVVKAPFLDAMMSGLEALLAGSAAAPAAAW